MGCLVFKTSEALHSVWWVRLLPLPPNSNLGTSGNRFVKDKGHITYLYGTGWVYVGYRENGVATNSVYGTSYEASELSEL